MIMYSIYNVETLEQLTKTVQHIYNTTTSNERLLARQTSSLTICPMYANVMGMQHFNKLVIIFKNYKGHICSII